MTNYPEKRLTRLRLGILHEINRRIIIFFRNSTIIYLETYFFNFITQYLLNSISSATLLNYYWKYNLVCYWNVSIFSRPCRIPTQRGYWSVKYFCLRKFGSYSFPHTFYEIRNKVAQVCDKAKLTMLKDKTTISCKLSA